MEKLYSVKGAAEALGGLSKNTIEVWLSRGRLKKTKVGSRTMIRESELERFLAASAQPRVAA
ncbi:MAG TPA: helix-turn-helix domain-containing protein [Ktedonobacteraceae bacterium]